MAIEAEKVDDEVKVADINEEQTLKLDILEAKDENSLLMANK
ncbi:hypothetical protein [Clostridium magnum]|uniref:Uncharacterized protein n=1 Tax=Clostridium magnum DSM 2767 TaxID=1121326 RepID=A0A162RID0_9CLOT|nr:hypothetical protein [Clostridium magnum]KZL89947.1 hypothetical protein CLMAG_44310 [Clostridium magnum DSM 2767]SHJ33359.1 hypothetical protein SAMN02745944_05781 [Clostridium magnum DSM 2767]